MKGPSKYLNERFPYPFIYMYFDSWNPYPFWAQPPRIGHYKEYPRGAQYALIMADTLGKVIRCPS